MRYWVYKCNLNPQNGPDSGDWEYVFEQDEGGDWVRTVGVGWGRLSRHAELNRMNQGDHVIALQTGSRQVLVGLAEYVGRKGTGDERRVVLRPRARIGAKLPPLKKAHPTTIGKIDALQGGKIQTLYEITTADATRLLKAARAARSAEIEATVKGVVSNAALQRKKEARHGAGFGDSELNRRVEQAAVGTVTRDLERKGWRVTSVEAEKCGYDLRCERGRGELHVEVKGVRGSEVSFFITAAEVRYWTAHDESRVAVVTSALSKPKLTYFTGAQVKRFRVETVLHRAVLSVKR